MAEPVWKMEQTEAQFQQAVQQLATSLKWDWMHVRPSLNARNVYTTAVSGSLGSGWPDLVLCRGGRLIFAELKAEKGKLSANQIRVLNLLESAGHDVFCWRPSDWETIMETLR